MTLSILFLVFQHLGSWGNRRKPVPRAKAPPMLYVAEAVQSYLPAPDEELVDPIYPVDAFLKHAFGNIGDAPLSIAGSHPILRAST